MKRDPEEQLIKLNYQFYQQTANQFDQTRQTAWAGWQQLISLLPDKLSVLDLGCGNGRFYQFLRQRYPGSFKYVGVDFCPNLIQIAQQRYPEVQFVDDSVFHYQPTQSFTLIVFWAVLHHIPGYQQRLNLLIRYRPWLKPGGWLAFSLWQFDTLPIWHKATPVSPHTQDYLLPWQNQTNARYCHLFTATELEELNQQLKQNGLQLVATYQADGRHKRANRYCIYRAKD